MTQDIQGAAPEVKELKSLEPQPVSEKKRLWQFFWRTWAIPGLLELRGPDEPRLPLQHRPHA